MTQDRALLAAEFVLGTLSAGERDEAHALRESDAAFDRAVREWERRLAPLAQRIDAAAPSSHVWEGVRARTEAVRAPAAVLVLQRRVQRWRVATLMAGTLAAALALFVLDRDILRDTMPRPGETYVAAVNRGGDKPALIVRVDLATHSVTVRPVEAQTPPGKSLELWYIGAGQAPKSMGLVGTDRANMPMPDAMDVQAATFAVSVEPAGGSPSGAPTGPVVYKGALVAE